MQITNSLFEITDIVSSEEINDLLDYYSSLDLIDEDKKATRFPIEESSFNYIVDRFKERLGNVIKVDASFFLDNSIVGRPYMVHSDYGIGLNNKLGLPRDGYPYYNTLIPLEHQQDMHTVIFNESSYEGPHWDNKDWCPCWHLPEINSNSWIAKKELLTHVINQQPNSLKKLSLKKIFNWVPGTAICWPRNLLHCGGYFDQNLSTRISLIIWFSLENP